MNENQKINKSAELEALLFMYGEPVKTQKVASILELSENDTKELILQMNNEYRDKNRGLCIIQESEKIQLVTKPEVGDFVQKIIQNEMQEQLTSAATETLALISYSGPLSRSQIDYVRGVNSSFILRSLLMRGLVDRKPDPKRKNSYLYGMSFNLLRKLNLENSGSLPDYEKYKNLVKDFLVPSNDKKEQSHDAE